MAVLVGAWVELAITPASVSTNRVDLIAERINPSGMRDLRVVYGPPSLDLPPPVPAGYERVAAVRVAGGQASVVRCHIGD
jgi:hypothetical protein